MAHHSQYDPDTNQMLSGSDDKTFKIFDVRTGVCTGSIPATGAVGNLQCQGNVLMAVLKRENDVFWYDMRNGSLVRQLAGHEKAVRTHMPTFFSACLRACVPACLNLSHRQMPGFPIRVGLLLAVRHEPKAPRDRRSRPHDLCVGPRQRRVHQASRRSRLHGHVVAIRFTAHRVGVGRRFHQGVGHQLGRVYADLDRSHRGRHERIIRSHQDRLWLSRQDRRRMGLFAASCLVVVVKIKRNGAVSILPSIKVCLFIDLVIGIDVSNR